MIVDDGFDLVLNKGLRDAVVVGDKYVVFDMGPQLYDPDTNEDLGALEIVRGTGYVVAVQEKICVLRSLQTRKVPRSLANKERIIESTISHSPRNTLAIIAAKASLVGELDDRVDELLPFRSPTRGDYAKKV